MDLLQKVCRETIDFNLSLGSKSMREIDLLSLITISYRESSDTLLQNSELRGREQLKFCKIFLAERGSVSIT